MQIVKRSFLVFRYLIRLAAFLTAPLYKSEGQTNLDKYGVAAHNILQNFILRKNLDLIPNLIIDTLPKSMVIYREIMFANMYVKPIFYD